MTTASQYNPSYESGNLMKVKVVKWIWKREMDLFLWLSLTNKGDIMQKSIGRVQTFRLIFSRSIGGLVTDTLITGSLIIEWLSDLFLTLRNNPRYLWPLRHLIRVIRRHDLTQKDLPTYIPTQYPPTYLPTYVPPLENILKEHTWKKTGDAGDIITTNFLYFPPNFRLRTRF